jgi:tyrosine decarboxylase/aspartate 1-decarboxylase
MNFPSKGLTNLEITQKLEDFARKANMYPPELEKNLTLNFSLAGLDDIRTVATDAVSRFLDVHAPLDPHDDDGGIGQMQSEIIAMSGTLWGSDQSPHGTITAGGTESNILALYTARNLAHGRRGSVVLPSTAHPSFFKGCSWFGLEPIVVPVTDELVADPEAMGEAIRDDTIAIAASCGAYPGGLIDPIEEIGKIASERSLYFHVDAAWGGFICPWLKELGYKIPEFGFRIRGVSSVCGDMHKMGFSVIPAGAIIFRDEELLRMAGSSITGAGWTYQTPGLLGTRPAATIAATWAVFNYLGREGYISLAKKCMDLTNLLIDGVERIPGFSRWVTPKINLAHIVSTSKNMDAVKGGLLGMGWRFWDTAGRPLSKENSIVVAVLPYHERVIPRFLEDLKAVGSSV